jgi:Legionella pneumophila major outer membrane protein precursor
MCWKPIVAGMLAWSLLLASWAEAQDASEAVSVAFAPAGQPSLFAGVYVFGEGLYVWPHRDNLQIASLTSGSSESLSWSGALAFQVGAGYRLPDTSWDAAISFAYFHAKSQRTVTAPDGSTLLPVLATSPAAHTATDADGDSGLTYSVLDLDVGNSLRINDSFALRLFGGVLVASINQSFKCIYGGGNRARISTSSTAPSASRAPA